MDAFAAEGRVVEPCPESKAWVAIRMIDLAGKPARGVQYRIRLPDRSIEEGVLDADGSARIDNIMTGQCAVSFPGLDKDAWESL
jgi:hypothetical protein